jgi:transposase
MARPRIFISSTYYDLKYVRSDLERFVRELGYEPIRHETGSIPYGKDTQLEEYAYKEL